MPLRIRQLKSKLAQSGFTTRPAKGSHTYWTHPGLPGINITLSGKDVEKQLRRLKEQIE